MKYYRFCEGLKDIGRLVPENVDVNDLITDNQKDYYRSIYYYSEEQKNLSEEKVGILRNGCTFTRPRGIAGILDVTTNRLVFDFDSGDNLENARNDAIELVSRLVDKGIDVNDLQIAFSGKKGFSVDVETTQEFTPVEVKNIVMNLASDLTTIDHKIYNPSRVVRVPLTKHQDSALYKFPLSFTELRDLSLEEIKSWATNVDGIDIRNKWRQVCLPSAIVDFRSKSIEDIVENSQLSESISDIAGIDFTQKLPFLSAAKYVLHCGLFPPGMRHNAMMILAATYKAVGFTKEDSYRLLKSVAERQAKNYKQDRFNDGEIWNDILGYVYSERWQGGQFGSDDPILKTIEAQLPAHIKRTRYSNNLVSAEEMFVKFEKFATDIDKNTLKFGIKTLDDNIQLITGTSIGIVGSPGTGKCLGLNVPVLMFDGTIKMSQDVVVGDRLMGPDGKKRTVINTTTGRQTMYRVKAKDGSVSYECNRQHVLRLKYGDRGILNITVGNYRKIPKNFRAEMRGFRPDELIVDKDTLDNISKNERYHVYGLSKSKFRISVSEFKREYEIEVEHLGMGKYYGFTLMENPHFLLGDLTITHNSTIAMDLIERNSLAGEVSIFYSMDMGETVVSMKQLQRLSGLPSKNIFNLVKENPEKYRELKMVALDNAKNVVYSYRRGITPKDVEDDIIQFEDRTGKKVRLVVIDYIESIASSLGLSDLSHASGIATQQLTSIANKLDVLMVILLQTQKSNHPGDPLTSLRDIKGSSLIEQELTLALGISREGHPPKYAADDFSMTVNVIKNRIGPLGQYDIKWIGSKSMVGDLTDDERVRLEELRTRKSEDKKNEDGYSGW